MRTYSRLYSSYLDANIINFDNKSKFIIFSDIHRGDNSISDEFAHNQYIYYHALKTYFNNGYTYIELGDGDELWEHSKFKDVRYAHSDIYDLLKEFHRDNRFIFVYGNHNMEFKNKNKIKKLSKYYDEYEEREESLFENIKVHEGIRLVNEKKNIEIFAVHGHQGDLINDQLWLITRFLNRHFWRYMHIIGFRNPASPAKNVHKMHKIEKRCYKFIKKHHIPIIIGHTHRAKFPKNGNLPYFNTGCCIHPRKINGIEITNCEISLVEWRIFVNDIGKLQVRKKFVRGPLALKNLCENIKKN